MNLLEFLTKLLVSNPFYPHWLANRKSGEGNAVIERALVGRVLEVGAGDGSKKGLILQKNSKINEYVATDFSSWDSEFEKINILNKKDGKISKFLFGYNDVRNLDGVCDAIKLPYKNCSFDCHISFEVLEHIEDPFKYFSEAVRVTKDGGVIAFSAPLLYRVNGGEPEHRMDYYRFVCGFFYKISEQFNLKIIDIFSNIGLGTSVAEMVNQWVILRIRESSWILKVILFVLSPLIFFVNNVVGLLVGLKPDRRFATRFHVIFKKN